MGITQEQKAQAMEKIIEAKLTEKDAETFLQLLNELCQAPELANKQELQRQIFVLILHSSFLRSLNQYVCVALVNENMPIKA